MRKLTPGNQYVCSVEALTSKRSDSRPVMEVNNIKIENDYLSSLKFSPFEW